MRVGVDGPTRGEMSEPITAAQLLERVAKCHRWST